VHRLTTEGIRIVADVAEVRYAATGTSTADAHRAVECGLGESDAAVLVFERQWWRYAGAKEAAIRDQFGWTATRYYQVLNSLLDEESALAFDPMLVKRLRRLRESRQRARSARRLTDR
jgi:hypothetical protein